MSKAKLHYDATGDSPIPRSLCGDFTARITLSVERVTCKLCLRRLAAAETRPLADPVARYVDAIFDGRAPETEDFGGLPVLTPSTWARRHCGCGDCHVCRYFRRLRQIDYIAPWREEKRIPGERRTRFSSVTHALEVYVAGKEDGASAGGWGSQLDVFRTLGVRVQAEGDNSSRAERAADDVIEVEGALAVAYDAHNDRGLGREKCVGILLARVVGRLSVTEGAYGRRSLQRVPVPAEDLAELCGVSVAVVGGIVKSGRQRVYEHLHRKGLVPERRKRREEAA